MSYSFHALLHSNATSRRQKRGENRQTPLAATFFASTHRLAALPRQFPILNPTFIAFVVAAPNLLGSPALHSVTMPFAARTSSVCIATMKTPSSLFETHNTNSPRQRTMKKRVKKHEKNPSETGVGNGATGARPGGGFWGHLKYYINRRDCVRSQLSSELRKITILHEIPPFLGSKMSPKMRKIC